MVQSSMVGPTLESVIGVNNYPNGITNTDDEFDFLDLYDLLQSDSLTLVDVKMIAELGDQVYKKETARIWAASSEIDGAEVKRRLDAHNNFYQIFLNDLYKKKLHLKGKISINLNYELDVIPELIASDSSSPIETLEAIADVIDGEGSFSYEIPDLIAALTLVGDFYMGLDERHKNSRLEEVYMDIARIVHIRASDSPQVMELLREGKAGDISRVLDEEFRRFEPHNAITKRPTPHDVEACGVDGVVYKNSIDSGAPMADGGVDLSNFRRNPAYTGSTYGRFISFSTELTSDPGYGPKSMVFDDEHPKGYVPFELGSDEFVAIRRRNVSTRDPDPTRDTKDYEEVLARDSEGNIGNTQRVQYTDSKSGTFILVPNNGVMDALADDIVSEEIGEEGVEQLTMYSPLPLEAENVGEEAANVQAMFYSDNVDALSEARRKLPKDVTNTFDKEYAARIIEEDIAELPDSAILLPQDAYELVPEGIEEVLIAEELLETDTNSDSTRLENDSWVDDILRDDGKVFPGVPTYGIVARREVPKYDFKRVGDFGKNIGRAVLGTLTAAALGLAALLGNFYFKDRDEDNSYIQNNLVTEEGIQINDQNQYFERPTSIIEPLSLNGIVSGEFPQVSEDGTINRLGEEGIDYITIERQVGQTLLSIYDQTFGRFTQAGDMHVWRNFTNALIAYNPETIGEMHDLAELEPGTRIRIPTKIGSLDLGSIDVYDSSNQLQREESNYTTRRVESRETIWHFWDEQRAQVSWTDYKEDVMRLNPGRFRTIGDLSIIREGEQLNLPTYESRNNI